MPPIRSVLIANRAEIALRILRTCHDLGLRTVAVYSEADRLLPHVAAADQAVCIGGAPAAESYLDSQALLQAAERSGADAIHPGYGFLSESAAFADAVTSAGLVWIGPPPAAIRAMGDKAAARTLASACGVPVVPGFDSEGASDQVLTAAATELGVPLLVKAAAGGGGRGMRRVDQLSALPEALLAARREAQAAFGNDRLLLERYISRPRHIEVQILADAHGHVLHLFERECSIQRRHQKIIEEAPASCLSAELRGALGQAAVQVASAAGYVGVGTVEFLVAGDDYWFLEMNTRLQVEHPVTEEVTGHDLVALQLAVAEGAPLPFDQRAVHQDGHAIEARVYAEDPARDYLPGSGPLLRFELESGPFVRVEAGYCAGNQVGIHYDPMLAKVIAWGPDRRTASRRLARALNRAWIPGVVTNLPLLRDLLHHPAWDAAALHTGFLAEHGLPKAPPEHPLLGIAAALLLGSSQRAKGAAWPAATPAGWRLAGPALQADRYRCGGEEIDAQWRVLPDGLQLLLPQGEHHARLLQRRGDVLQVELDGVSACWRVLQHGEVTYVHSGLAEAMVTRLPRLPEPELPADPPGTLTAPTPGTVVSVQVQPGDAVTQGQVLVVLEAMKMEHSVSAPSAGEVLEVRVAVGDTVDQGALLVRYRHNEP